MSGSMKLNKKWSISDPDFPLFIGFGRIEAFQETCGVTLSSYTFVIGFSWGSESIPSVFDQYKECELLDIREDN